jgi:hypothetical protein
MSNFFGTEICKTDNDFHELIAREGFLICVKCGERMQIKNPQLFAALTIQRVFKEMEDTLREQAKENVALRKKISELENELWNFAALDKKEVEK